jgi:DEAD/DEAH box helicase domain-containing protein
MCDPRDLGVALDTAPPPAAFEPDLYLYDNYPGGIGQSAPLYEMNDGLLGDAVELLARCPCGDGCPSCVGPVGEVGERGKHAAMRILHALSSKGQAETPVLPLQSRNASV